MQEAEEHAVVLTPQDDAEHVLLICRCSAQQPPEGLD